MNIIRRIKILIGMVAGLWLTASVIAADLEREPINYSKAPAKNAVSRLQERIDSSKVQLKFDERLGFLPALLRELNVPVSSQTLVFSKTSLQRQRIGPATPRALYFNDEVHIGYCQLGVVLEISVADPQLGTVFYSVDQNKEEKLRFDRQQDNCLTCHGSSQNQGLPGHLIRSVFPDHRGSPILSMGSFRVDQNSPFKQRWGGWYVSGRNGKQVHLGNMMIDETEKRQPEEIDNSANMNVTDLKKYFQTADYLSPHSDIVALMVLEHQAEMHNRITRANLLTRIALHDEVELNKELGRKEATRSELTQRRIRSACEPLVKYLLFAGEFPLTEKIEGSSTFVKEFTQLGPRDRHNRSLRDLDLQKRLLKYPCSYLIYTEAFRGLPAAASEYVWQRLGDILSGKDTSLDFAHLSSAHRRAIREILIDTCQDVPATWKKN